MKTDVEAGVLLKPHQAGGAAMSIKRLKLVTPSH